MDTFWRFVRRALYQIDVVLGLGETLSYRFAVLRDNGWFVGCVVCKFLDIFDKDHCDLAIRHEDRPN
jgi:hypothetical protein